MSAEPQETSSFYPPGLELEVFLMGTVDFAALLAIHANMTEDVALEAGKKGIILLCEHPPVITIGIEGSYADVLVEPEELISRQMEIRWINRGGGTMVHAPGQVAVYPILPLDSLNLGLSDFVGRMEQSLIQMAADLDVEATTGNSVPGAVCRSGQFAFVGAGVQSGVSLGGLFVNVSMSPEALGLVRWSDSKVPVTTLAAQRQRPTAMSAVRESLIRHVATTLGTGDYQLHTGHPMLTRTTRRVYMFS